MRKGRRIDHYWNVRKYKGDMAYYAYCSCGWYYCCGDALNNKDDNKWTLYPYCPKCGAHKKWYNAKIVVIDKFQFE